jgi:hypothetical protein
MLKIAPLSIAKVSKKAKITILFLLKNPNNLPKKTI